jgi:DNA topoisomerase-2
MSLNMTIVGMAQDFVGSNNINLLMPIGMFGTRAMGGKEAASPRYIFTNLNEQTRLLFPEEDLPLMAYIVEEGLKIEPEHYVPILPLVLANGADGIGTGWATTIPQYSPLDIVQNLRNRLKHRAEFKRMKPWYRGYTGSIEYSQANNSYIFHGTYRFRDDNCLEIQELPIWKWTSDYKVFLEGLMKNDEIDDVKEYHKDNTVSFVIKGTNLRDFERSEGGISKKFKLTSSVSLNNFVLFDSKQRIKRYANEVEILEEFFPIRYGLYTRRKEFILGVLNRELKTM